MIGSARRARPKASTTIGPEVGFTLIEMIVSLAILSIALGVLLAAFSQDLDRQQLSRKQTEARLFATALLDESTSAGAENPIAKQGVAGDGLSWSLGVAPYGSDADRKAWRFAPAQVTATVQWRMNGRAYGLSLRTLRPIAADGAR
ncbi:MAG: type II secretion system protein [Rhizomicrobium sp.]